MGRGRWLPPFEGQTAAERRRRLLVCLLVFVLALVTMGALWPPSPGNIVDFELAGDDGAAAFLDAWTGTDGARAALAILADFPFLVAYGLGVALLLDAVAGWTPGRRGEVLARGAWVPIAAAGFDVLENVCLLVVIAGRTDTWPDLAESFASIKFALIYVVTPIFLVAGLVSAGLARRAAEPSR
jgi:hypothetical protein